jgi:hypothetical protein
LELGDQLAVLLLAHLVNYEQTLVFPAEPKLAHEEQVESLAHILEDLT